MTKHCVCPRGHRWTLSSDDPLPTSNRWVICPFCGTGCGFLPPADGAEAEAPVKDYRAGAPEIPGYDILKTLGHEGLATLYQARQKILNRLVTLYLSPRVDAAQPAQVFEPWVHALVAAAKLFHPNILPVLEAGFHEGRFYYTTPLLEWKSLAQKRHDFPMPPQAAAQLVGTLARAVHHIHQQRLIHRDLKLANVLVTADGTPYLTNFELALLLDRRAAQAEVHGSIVGTPLAMAPEQVLGKWNELGPETDVYGLGGILYELLTGRPPFTGKSPIELFQQIITVKPAPPRDVRPELPRDLEAVCLKCLEKEPRHRYASAELLAEDLHRCLPGMGTGSAGKSAPFWTEWLRWGRRRRG